MKTGKLISAILIGLFLSISCSKEEDDLDSQNCVIDCTEIVGKIMTDNGTTPISNPKLTVQWDNIPYLGSGTIRTKATTNTDSDGNFYLKFFINDDELEKGVFRLFYEPLDNDKYLRTDLNGISLFQITRDTTLTKNHNVPKKAFMNLSLLNLNQIQSNDSFMTEFSYPGPSEFSQSIGGEVIGWNSESDQNHLIEIAGNQPIDLKIYRTINGVSTTEIETIYFDAGTTSNYTIDFNN